MNNNDNKPKPASEADAPKLPKVTEQPAGEIGGPKGLEPTRFGDWSDDKGRCTDF